MNDQQPEPNLATSANQKASAEWHSTDGLDDKSCRGEFTIKCHGEFPENISSYENYCGEQKRPLLPTTKMCLTVETPKNKWLVWVERKHLDELFNTVKAAGVTVQFADNPKYVYCRS